MMKCHHDTMSLHLMINLLSMLSKRETSGNIIHYDDIHGSVVLMILMMVLLFCSLVGARHCFGAMHNIYRLGLFASYSWAHKGRVLWYSDRRVSETLSPLLESTFPISFFIIAATMNFYSSVKQTVIYISIDYLHLTITLPYCWCLTLTFCLELWTLSYDVSIS